MGKPTILVFATAYHPFIGGAEVAIEEVGRRLKDRFDFYIITSRFRKDIPKVESRIEGTVWRVGWGTRFDKWLLLLAPFFLPPIWKFRKCAHVVWGMDLSQGSLAAVFFSFLSDKPLVVSIQYGEGDQRIARGRLGFINLAFRLILSAASFVAAESSYLLKVSRAYGYRGEAQVFPNGVDEELFKSRSQSRAINRVVVTTSRLVPKNGVDILIRSMAEVRKKFSDIKCLIVGDGPERKKLEILVSGLKLEGNVAFLGAVAHFDIPRYLNQAMIFARPSRSEGMGNSFLEALASGLPIVGTPVGGIPDIITDGVTGLFCQAEDPQDLARKITELIENPELREKIVDEGKKVIKEKFSWESIAFSYQKVFESLTACSLSIVIATPLYPPQIGGPATYARYISSEFKKGGHTVKILSFGRVLKYPPGIRHLLYFVWLFFSSLRADVLFCLDASSVGLPSAVVSRLTGKCLVVRHEGDRLWESFVERTRDDITLREFYTSRPVLNGKEKFIQKTVRWVLHSASLVAFSSTWRRRMVIKTLPIDESKTLIVPNALPEIELKETQRKKVVLWAGRMLYLKNLYHLIHAFTASNKGEYELYLIGDGPERKNIADFILKNDYQGVLVMPPLDREDLLDKLREISFLVLPSLSDVGPNIVADAIATKTPFIMTRESGSYEYLKEIGVFVNPRDEKDLVKKIQLLMDPKGYKEIKEKLNQFSDYRSWSKVAEDWHKSFAEIL